MKRTLIYLSSLALAGIIGLNCVGCASGSDHSASNVSSSASAVISNASGTSDDTYVDVSWLKGNSDNVVILDARSSDDFMTQHIPGAVNLHWTDTSNVVDVQQGEAGWAELLDAKTLSVSLSRIGIDNSKPVVVYTDTKDGWGEDGRMYWTLREAGVSDVKILNGGWTQWLYQQGDHVSGLKTQDLGEIEQVDMAYVKDHQGTAVLVDARAPEEYSGETNMGEARNGRIPGSVNVPYVGLINEDGTVKTADELESIFRQANLNKDDEIIVYCTGGVRAAAVAEILKDSGYTNVKVYTAGFSEWAGGPVNEVEID